MKHYWLYVLKLEENKYYVGITSKTPEVRYKQHVDGFLSAQWTKKYKPIGMIESKDLGEVSQEEAEYSEMQKTLELMKKYGYQNVRGAKLNYSGKYVKLGSRYFKDRDFEALVTTVVLLIAIGVLIWKS